MAGPLDCIQKKARAKKVTQRAVDDLKQLVNDYMATNPGRSQLDAAQWAMQRMQARLTTRRVQVAKQISAFKAFEQRAKDFMDARGMEVIGRSLLTRDIQGRVQGPNVEARIHEIRNHAHGLFTGFLKRYHTRLLGLSQDRAGLNNFVDELHGRDTGDAAAKELANAWKTIVDPYLWRRYRRAGGDLTPRNNWNLPQFSDPRLVSRVTLEQWKNFIRPRIDRMQTLDHSTGEPVTEARLEELLDDAYETISTGGWNDVQGFRNRGKLANRRTAERVFQFKDGKSWREYDEMFGSGGDIYGVIVGHIERMARDTALMEILGPNPDATMRGVMALIDKDVNTRAAAGQKKPDSVRRFRHGSTEESRSIANLYAVATGQVDIPVWGGLANFAASIRNILSSAQLDGAMLSAVSDVNNIHLAAKFHQLSTSKMLGRAIGNLVRGAFDDSSSEFAARLGLGLEAWTQQGYGALRTLGELNGPRWSRMLVDGVMRATLLTPWTQAGRHAFGLEMLGDLGARAARKEAYASLPQGMRASLERRGFSSKDWDAVVGSRLEDGNGNPYVSLLNVAEQSGDTASKLAQVISEEVEFAIPSSSMYVRAQFKQGLSAGTWAGEALRGAAQYKSYPMMMIHTHLWRATLGRMDDMPMSKVAYAAHLAIWTSVLGAIALQAKQIRAGKDPIPIGGPSDPAQMAKFWGAAVLQGGSLGIFGDFLFSPGNRYGGSFQETIGGPTLGLVNDTANLTIGNVINLARGEEANFAREMARFGRSYTPGGDIWYTGQALNRVLWDQLEMALDPGARRSFRQREARAKQDYGNQFFWRPGDLVPFRAPDLTRAVE